MFLQKRHRLQKLVGLDCGSCQATWGRLRGSAKRAAEPPTRDCVDLKKGAWRFTWVPHMAIMQSVYLGCILQLGVPRAQQQHLGNRLTENIAFKQSFHEAETNLKTSTSTTLTSKNLFRTWIWMRTCLSFSGHYAREFPLE